MAVNHDHIEEALQSCLDRIRNEQVTLDSVLQGYPDLVDVLRPELETAIWLRQWTDQLDPRPGFIHASRCRVINQIEVEAVASRQGEPRLGWLQRSLDALRQKKHTLQFALTILLVLSLFIGSTGVALASQASLPGDALYPVKISTENAALSLSSTYQGTARLHIEYAQRRLIEIQSLELNQRYGQIPETVNSYDSQVGQAIQALNQLSIQEPAQAAALARSLQVTLAVQTQAVFNLGKTAPQETQREVARVMDISRNGLSAIEGMTGPQPVEMETPTSTPTPIGTTVPDLLPGSTPVPGAILFTPTLSSEATLSIQATGTLTSTATLTSSPTYRPLATSTPKPTRVRPTDPPPTDTQKPPPPSNTPTPPPVPTTDPYPTP